MRRIDFHQPESLHGVHATRAIEKSAAAHLPAHTLMARAGLSIARLTLALAPHTKTIWIACGPGNNGGDGLIAATHLLAHAKECAPERTVRVTLAGDTASLPADAAHALQLALSSGVTLAPHPPPDFDFAIDALLGIGITRTPEAPVADHLAILDASSATTLCVDLPSGLMADTGALLRNRVASHAPKGPRHTLSLLTLKPGLFTAQGRDVAGEVWFDDLGVSIHSHQRPEAQLTGFTATSLAPLFLHTAHKGTRGEVLVIGGQGMSGTGQGMTGAAVLAARSALRSGAGRVYINLLEPDAISTGWDPLQPELMFRSTDATKSGDLIERSATVCGCGGGQAVAPMLPILLTRAQTLVLDADALNALATNPGLQALLTQRQTKDWITVITPPPLEAARLLGTTTAVIMADRLAAARSLSERFGVIAILKGSGTVIHGPGETPLINPTGNGALATAGTGDVLAGMLGAALATRSQTQSAFTRAAHAVFHHGHLADQWVAYHGQRSLCADQLTQQFG